MNRKPSTILVGENYFAQRHVYDCDTEAGLFGFSLAYYVNQTKIICGLALCANFLHYGGEQTMIEQFFKFDVSLYSI